MLIWSTVELRFVNITCQDIFQRDLVKRDFLRRLIEHFFVLQNTAIEFQVIHQTREHLVHTGRDPLAVGVLPYKQGFVFCGHDLTAGGYRERTDSVPVQLKGHSS